MSDGPTILDSRGEPVEKKEPRLGRINVLKSHFLTLVAIFGVIGGVAANVEKIHGLWSGLFVDKTNVSSALEPEQPSSESLARRSTADRVRSSLEVTGIDMLGLADTFKSPDFYIKFHLGERLASISPVFSLEDNPPAGAMLNGEEQPAVKATWEPSSFETGSYLRFPAGVAALSLPYVQEVERWNVTVEVWDSDFFFDDLICKAMLSVSREDNGQSTGTLKLKGLDGSTKALLTFELTTIERFDI